MSDRLIDGGEGPCLARSEPNDRLRQRLRQRPIVREVGERDLRGGEFSAERSGRTANLVSARQYASTSSCPETVRNASRPKKSCVKSTLPCGVRGRLARSRIDTRNNALAGRKD
jgi:hypothetical protein